jgi:hypothetical protein
VRWLLPIALCACSDFDPPSALTHPQVIAVRATPSALAPGEHATLDALVAGPDGVLAPTLAWHLVQAPEGTMLDGNVLAAGAEGEVVVALDADALAAEKRIVVGAHAENPIVAVIADGVAVDELRATRGSTIALAAVAPSVSWYCTLGEITKFRGLETELRLSEAGEGTLIVVARDGAGGVAWRIVSVVVN